MVVAIVVVVPPRQWYKCIAMDAAAAATTADPGLSYNYGSCQVKKVQKEGCTYIYIHTHIISCLCSLKSSPLLCNRILTDIFLVFKRQVGFSYV